MTTLAKNASITLLTGLPGSGKTLRVVHFIEQAIEAGEVVFVSNLNGLKLPHVPFDDPREWRDLPPGSVLVVDEAQKFFRSRRSGEPPKYLTDMETIRHDGVRLLLTTQQPDYLDTHLRGLVGLHEHLLREDGKDEVKIWRHNEVMDNVRSDKARGRYDNEVWAYPKRLFDHYESAQVHTVKRTFKSRWKRGVIMALGAVALIGGVIWQFSGRFDDGGGVGIGDGGATVRAGGGAGPQAGGPPARKEPTLTALDRHRPEAQEEYFANVRARDPLLPWSAPIYDSRQAVAEPRLFCVIGGAGVDANGEYRERGYTCLTEQGTRVVLTDERAALIARHGEPYNPFRAPQAHQAPFTSSGPAPVGSGAGQGPVARPAASGAVGSAPRPMVDATFGTITRATL